MNNSDIAEDKPRKNFISVIFTVMLMLILALSFLSFFTNVHTTVVYDLGWKISAAIVLTLFLIMMIASILTNKQTIKLKGGLFKKILTMLAGIFGLSFLTGFALFSGVPVALHYINNSPGSIEVTVTKKQDTYSKRKCRPRMIIKEFTFFTSEHICPDVDTFRKIKTGSKVKLIGNVSTYGIEPKEIQWVQIENKK